MHAVGVGQQRLDQQPCKESRLNLYPCGLVERTRASLHIARAAGSSGPSRKELPIFPLNVVALPNATVPLQIFEPRYRVLFNTLLDGAENVDEGLVQKESPFVGTRKFGMCFVTRDGRMASIGTTLEIQQHVTESDGRIYVTQKGIERFEIKKVVREKPVLVCEVEVLPEDNDCSEEVTALAKEVADLFRNTLRLNLKMVKAKAEKAGRSASSLVSDSEDDPLEPEELTTLSPSQLSYWMAHVFAAFMPSQESRLLQQMLLEEDSTKDRLEKEKDVLGQTLKFYSAASALEGVFSSGSETVQPPPGGPD